MWYYFFFIFIFILIILKLRTFCKSPIRYLHICINSCTSIKFPNNRFVSSEVISELPLASLIIFSKFNSLWLYFQCFAQFIICLFNSNMVKLVFSQILKFSTFFSLKNNIFTKFFLELHTLIVIVGGIAMNHQAQLIELWILSFFLYSMFLFFDLSFFNLVSHILLL